MAIRGSVVGVLGLRMLKGLEVEIEMAEEGGVEGETGGIWEVVDGHCSTSKPKQWCSSGLCPITHSLPIIHQ